MHCWIWKGVKGPLVCEADQGSVGETLRAEATAWPSRLPPRRLSPGRCRPPDRPTTLPRRGRSTPSRAPRARRRYPACAAPVTGRAASSLRSGTSRARCSVVGDVQRPRCSDALPILAATPLAIPSRGRRGRAVPTPPQAGRQPSATLQAVIPLAIPPAPATPQAPCPPLLRRYGNGASAVAPRAPLHAACSRQAPRRRTSVTDACWSHAAFRYASPSLRACHGPCFRLRRARPTPSAPFAPSGVSLRSTSSSPAAVPVLRFSVRSSTSRSPSAGRYSFAALRSDARPPPTVPLITHSEAQHRNSAPLLLATQIVQFDHVVPLAETRSVRTSLHAIRRQCSVLDPAQLARCASPARKLAPKRKSCSGTPCTGLQAPRVTRPSRSRGRTPRSGTQPDTPSLQHALVTPSRSNCSVLHYAPNAALRTSAPLPCPAAARGGALTDTATQSPFARTDGRLPMAPVTLAMDRQPSVLDRTASHKLPPKTPRGFPRRAPKGCRPPAAWPARPGG